MIAAIRVGRTSADDMLRESEACFADAARESYLPETGGPPGRPEPDRAEGETDR